MSQSSAGKQYPEEPSRTSIESRRKKLIICGVLFVIGIIGSIACESIATPLNLVWFAMGAVGLYGGIGFAIALHLAKKHYNEAMTSYKSECAVIDKENRIKLIMDLNQELAICQSQIEATQRELDEDERARERTDGFGELFSEFGSINSAELINNMDSSISRKKNDLEALRNHEKELHKQLEILGSP